MTYFAVASLLIHLTWIGQARGHKDDWQGKSANLKIDFQNAKVGDTFRIVIYEHRFHNVRPDRMESAARSKDGYFYFRLNGIDKPIYFSLFKDYSENKYPIDILNFYLLSPGDNVTISLHPGNVQNEPFVDYKARFAGVGSAKYTCKYKLNEILSVPVRVESIVSPKGEITQGRIDSLYNVGLRTLKAFKNRMISPEYEILSVDFFSSLEITRLERLSLYQGSLFQDSIKLATILNSYYRKIRPYDKTFTNSAKTFSSQYVQFVLDWLSIGKYRKGTTKRLRDEFLVGVYNTVKANYSGELRDRLLTLFILNQSSSKQAQALIEDALAAVSTAYCSEQLTMFSEMNSTGKPAFNFSLPDVNGNYIRLDSFKGKVVFVDFWFKGCSGCIHYYRDVVSKAEKYFSNDSNVVFISINIDTDKQKWIGAIESNLYTSPHIINLNTGMQGLMHPIIEKYRVTSYPRPLLIDKSGNVFSNNRDELRAAGPEGLIRIIIKALESST